MSAGGMSCRTSSTGGVLPYAVGPEVRQGTQMCHTFSPFGHSPNFHISCLFLPLLSSIPRTLTNTNSLPRHPRYKELSPHPLLPLPRSLQDPRSPCSMKVLTMHGPISYRTKRLRTEVGSCSD